MPVQNRPSGFAWDPERYSKSSSFRQQIAENLIAKLDLTGSGRVLDTGCGDGAENYVPAADHPDPACTFR